MLTYKNLLAGMRTSAMATGKLTSRTIAGHTVELANGMWYVYLPFSNVVVCRSQSSDRIAAYLWENR